MSSAATLGETALVERIRRRAGTAPSWVTLGIGDDAAVLEPPRGALDVVTTDSQIEHIHFRRAWTNAQAIGHKAVAVNLSDLAAMGATPRAILLSLALPPDLPVADFDDLVDGVVSAASAAGAVLVGGNLAQSPGPLVIDVTAIGAVARRRALSRSGGRRGDLLYVTGAIGAAAAGLAMLGAAVDRAQAGESARECIDRFERPEPRTRCGRLAAGSRSASACIDLSDGLGSGVRQLAEASGVGALLDADAIPVHAGAREWAARAGVDPVSFALAGGEDYELLFSVPRRKERGFLAAMKRCPGLPVTLIGRLVAEPGAMMNRGGVSEEVPSGFVHFARSSR